MADYSTSAALQPKIPCKFIPAGEREVLGLFGVDCDKVSGNKFFLSIEEYEANPQGEKSDLSKKAIAIIEAAGAKEDDEGNYDIPEDVMFKILKDVVVRSKGNVPYVAIEYAYTCSKMTIDGFGGSAIFITAEDRSLVSTCGWISEKIAESNKMTGRKDQYGE